MLFPPRGDVGPIIPRLCTGLSSICNTAEVPAPTPHLPTDAPAQPWGGWKPFLPFGSFLWEHLTWITSTHGECGRRGRWWWQCAHPQLLTAIRLETSTKGYVSMLAKNCKAEQGCSVGNTTSVPTRTCGLYSPR